MLSCNVIESPGGDRRTCLVYAHDHRLYHVPVELYTILSLVQNITHSSQLQQVWGTDSPDDLQANGAAVMLSMIEHGQQAIVFDQALLRGKLRKVQCKLKHCTQR